MSVAAFTLSRSNWREFSATMDVIRPEKIQMAFSHSPTLAIFAGEALGEFGNMPMRGMGRNVQTGGHAILRRVVLGKHAGASRVSGPYGTHTLAPDHNTRPSEATWKFYNHAVVIANHERRINQGTAAVASFLDEQVEEVSLALADIVADDIFALTVAPNAINSIPALISADDSVMGLSGSTYDKWNSRGVSTVGTAPASISFASGSFAAQGLSDMRRAYNNASEGMIQPNVIVTEHDTHERYEATLQPQERFAGAVAVADGSFRALAFRGVPVLPDRKCTSGHMFFLRVGDRRNGLQMDFLSGAAFDFDEWKPSGNQSVMVRPMEATCQMSIGNRHFGSNKLTSITD